MSEVEEGVKESVEIIGAAVEEMINSVFEYLIAPYGTAEMAVLIDEDVTVVDMLRLMMKQVQSGEAEKWRDESKKRWEKLVEMLALARKIAAKVGKPVIEKNFTYETAMNVFKERRPDLYELCSKKEGERWLRKNIAEIVAFLTK